MNTWGTAFFHDHAASEGLGIKDHIFQGLYGNIIIERNPPRPYVDRHIPIVMSEIGYDIERMAKGPTPYFIMNGKAYQVRRKLLKKFLQRKG
ncbi:MAG: hypothetical protein KC444_03130 [Nitrosopumilus sp.]|nr:hypothetical protein [Nitrosopumilus sp.]